MRTSLPIPRELLTLLTESNQARPELIRNDELTSGVTYGDLELALMDLAAVENRHLVADFVLALWAESNHHPEPLNLKRTLAVTILLAGPACLPGEDVSMT